VPQLEQTLWGRLYSPHFEHFAKAGAESFHTEERLLSRLDFDTLVFGTAILNFLLNKRYYLNFYKLIILLYQ
jgi:hypothetical protein